MTAEALAPSSSNSRGGSAQDVHRKNTGSLKSRRKRASPLLYAVALVLLAMYLLPFLFILLVSLTPVDEATGSIPSRFAFENYAQALDSAPFVLYLLNSVIITLVATISQIALSCMAGYALAKLPLREARTVLMLLIGLLVLPAEIMMVPLFVMVYRMPLLAGNDLFGQGGVGMLDSYAALMLPHLVSALPIFLMRQFYVGLPDELGQAARVDGASEFRIFARIYTPLTLPAVAIVAVIAFQSAWNDFLWPLIVVRSNQMQTLQLGLTVFYQEHSTQWEYLMAVVLLMTLPIALLFLFGQRFFRSGLTAGGVK